jgi:antitoxin ParD1/3/4
MKISPPDSREASLDEQAPRRKDGTSRQYVRDLIRKDAVLLRFFRMLLKGVVTTPTAPVDASYYSKLRECVHACSGVRSKRIVPRSEAS